MTTDQTRLTSAARLWAAHNYPYLASALFALRILPGEPGLEMSVDTNWRVYVDSNSLAEVPTDQVGFQLVHLTGHLLRDHAQRAAHIGVSEDDVSHWVAAADAEINDDLRDMLTLPPGAVTPNDLKCPDGKFAEEYYEYGSESNQKFSDCGTGAHGHERSWNQEPPSDANKDDGVNVREAEILRRQVASDIVEHHRQVGEIPEGLLRWAAMTLDHKVDWRKELGAVLRRGLSESMGAVDYSNSRISRRISISPEVVLPSLRRRIPSIALVLDTSASMTERMLGLAVTEIKGLLVAVGIQNDAIRVISCDAEAEEAQRVRNVNDLLLKGGGGTDLRVGIENAIKLAPRPELVIVVTDGGTPWPDERVQGVEMFALLIGDNPPQPPNWIHCVSAKVES